MEELWIQTTCDTDNSVRLWMAGLFDTWEGSTGKYEAPELRAVTTGERH